MPLPIDNQTPLVGKSGPSRLPSGKPPQDKEKVKVLLQMAIKAMVAMVYDPKTRDSFIKQLQRARDPKSTATVIGNLAGMVSLKVLQSMKAKAGVAPPLQLGPKLVVAAVVELGKIAKKLGVKLTKEVIQAAGIIGGTVIDKAIAGPPKMPGQEMGQEMPQPGQGMTAPAPGMQPPGQPAQPPGGGEMGLLQGVMR